jgi:hypothetical protein
MATLGLTIGLAYHDALPVTADELRNFHEALNRALLSFDSTSKTAKRLSLLDTYMFDWMCAARVAEGPEPTVSPLRQEPA